MTAISQTNLMHSFNFLSKIRLINRQTFRNPIFFEYFHKFIVIYLEEKPIMSKKKSHKLPYETKQKTVCVTGKNNR